jgi:hypothetical protein
VCLFTESSPTQGIQNHNTYSEAFRGPR